MNRQQKCIYLIFILVIMLLGIETEAFQSGSSFLCTYSCTTTSSQDTLQQTSSHIIFSEKLFLLEGIRQSCNTSCIRQNNRKTFLRNLRSFFSLLALYVLSPLLLYKGCYTYFYNIFEELLCSMVIISYIHLSDGKKPRYSYLY